MLVWDGYRCKEVPEEENPIGLATVKGSKPTYLFWNYYEWILQPFLHHSAHCSTPTWLWLNAWPLASHWCGDGMFLQWCFSNTTNSYHGFIKFPCIYIYRCNISDDIQHALIYTTGHNHKSGMDDPQKMHLGNASVFLQECIEAIWKEIPGLNPLTYQSCGIWFWKNNEYGDSSHPFPQIFFCMFSALSG